MSTFLDIATNNQQRSVKLLIGQAELDCDQGKLVLKSDQNLVVTFEYPFNSNFYETIAA
jgi:hypothetical protein